MTKRFNHVKREAWCKRLAKFDGCNMTVAAFCRREKVSQTSFYYWSKRIGDRGMTKSSQQEAVSAMTPEKTANDFVEVVVGDSIRVRIPTDRLGDVATLISHLQVVSPGSDDSVTKSRFQRIQLAATTTQP